MSDTAEKQFFLFQYAECFTYKSFTFPRLNGTRCVSSDTGV